MCGWTGRVPRPAVEPRVFGPVGRGPGPQFLEPLVVGSGLATDPAPTHRVRRDASPPASTRENPQHGPPEPVGGQAGNDRRAHRRDDQALDQDGPLTQPARTAGDERTAIVAGPDRQREAGERHRDQRDQEQPLGDPTADGAEQPVHQASPSSLTRTSSTSCTGQRGGRSPTNRRYHTRVPSGHRNRADGSTDPASMMGLV